MKQIFLYLTVALLVWAAVAAVGTTMAYDPLFWIEEGNIAQLNMSVVQITQVSDDDPTDAMCYIEAPLNITVRDQEGVLLPGATVVITGPRTDYANFTDANGTVSYTFNESEVTWGEERIAIRASKFPQYPYVEKLIYVIYAGVLNMEQGNTAVDVLAASYGASKMNISFTSVVVDTAKASVPEAGVNVTAVVTDISNIDTNLLYWTTDGDSGAQSGDSAFSPQSQITDVNGEVTFGIHVEQEESGNVEITISMTGTKESYMATTSSSSITINANGNCFIATAAYGSPIDEHLEVLRAFRDTVLLTNPVGKFIVGTYYTTSPPIAQAVAQSDHLRAATRLLLLTPLVYSSALCLNTTAFAALIILIALTLFILRRKSRVILKGIGYGALTISAFTVTVFTLGALGYELPVCAAVAAYLLPLIIPLAVAVCIMVWMESRSQSKPKTLP